MTRLRPSDPDDLERDPTGVQALLSGLPHPGPMPDDLVARISASLAQEEERRSAQHATVHGFDDSLRVGRARRWPALAGAAAAALVVGVAGYTALVPGGLGPTTEGGVASLADSTGTAAAGRAESRESGAHAPTQVEEDSSSQPIVRRSGRDYGLGTLAAQAALLDAAANHAPRAAGPGAGALVPDAAVISRCLAAVLTSPTTRAVVDVAEFDGRPAIVVVATGPTGRQVLVAPSTCGTTPTTRLLAGPVPLP